MRYLGEPSTAQRWHVDIFIGRATAVGRIREDVMNREQTASSNMRRPASEVISCRLDAVATVDEHKRATHLPVGGDDGRSANDTNHDVLQVGCEYGVSKEWQGVHLANNRIDERWVMPLPTSLVFFAATMMVDREQDCARLASGCSKPHR